MGDQPLSPLEPAHVEWGYGPGIYVVRDDLVLGGTKARAAHLLFEQAPELVFASPAEGYSQVALAATAKRLGRKATIVVAARATPHVHTRLAARLGAQVIEVRPGYLSVVQARAREYVEQTPGALLAPFGLDRPEILAHLTAVAQEVAARPDVQPSEIWSVAGSGTLSRALQAAWPDLPVHAVQIGRRLSPQQVGRARHLVAPERFGQPAWGQPPYPSNVNYDAKAWRFLKAEAKPGALFWNVAA